jgi:hypothetical protein
MLLPYGRSSKFAGRLEWNELQVDVEAVTAVSAHTGNRIRKGVAIKFLTDACYVDQTAGIAAGLIDALLDALRK